MPVTLVLTLLENNTDPRVFALALGPVSAVMFFLYIHRRYRNTDKSYQYENRTRIELENVQHFDQYERHIGRTRKSRIEGIERSRDPRQRLGAPQQGWWF